MFAGPLFWQAAAISAAHAPPSARVLRARPAFPSIPTIVALAPREQRPEVLTLHRPGRPEVITRPERGAPMSEEAVGNILSLVMRDTKMLARTLHSRSLAVTCELLRDRLPLAGWYSRYKLDEV